MDGTQPLTLKRATVDFWATIDRETRHEINRSRRVQLDAARAMFAELPDPETYAWHLPLHLVEALLAAWKHKTYGWMVADIHAAELRSLGLVGFGRGREGQGVTAFGWAVRTVLMVEAA